MPQPSRVLRMIELLLLLILGLMVFCLMMIGLGGWVGIMISGPARQRWQYGVQRPDGSVTWGTLTWGTPKTSRIESEAVMAHGGNALELMRRLVNPSGFPIPMTDRRLARADRVIDG